MNTTPRLELLAALVSARGEMEALLEQAGEARLKEPGVTGDWSIKDILAHITAWEERILAWAEALRPGTLPTPAPWSRDWSEDQVNAWIYEHNRDRPLPEVLARWRQVQQDVIEAVEGMSDEDLFSREIDWLGGTFANAVPGNSYDHLHNHAGEIRIWLAAQRNAE